MPTAIPDLGPQIYHELDAQLRASDWGGGAAEAHGLLTGLACYGLTRPNLGEKLYLFCVPPDHDATLFEGLFELILQDLNAANFVSHPLLPTPQAPTEHIEAAANWCIGFIQGYYHAATPNTPKKTTPAQEVVDDIMIISGLTPTSPDETTEQSLMEIEEYLKVGVQLVYDSRGE